MRHLFSVMRRHDMTKKIDKDKCKDKDKKVFFLQKKKYFFATKKLLFLHKKVYFFFVKKLSFFWAKKYSLHPHFVTMKLKPYNNCCFIFRFWGDFRLLLKKETNSYQLATYV